MLIGGVFWPICRKRWQLIALNAANTNQSKKTICRRWCWIKRGGRCQVAILTWCCDDGGLGGHYHAESILLSRTVLYCIVLYYPVLSCWERIIIPLKARLNHPQTSNMHPAQMPPTDPVIKHQNGKCLNSTCVMLDRFQPLFYFVPQDSHSQDGSTSVTPELKKCAV